MVQIYVCRKRDSKSLLTSKKCSNQREYSILWSSILATATLTNFNLRKRQFSWRKYLMLFTVLKVVTVQCVAQYPDGTSIRTLETKTQFLRGPFQFSVNEVFRMKAEHFSFKMKVLASLRPAKQSQKMPFCSGE